MNALRKQSYSLRLLVILLVVASVAGLGLAGWRSASVSARTAAETFTITPSAGEHGVITPPVAQTVAAGADVTFVMQPDIGFHVSDVLVDGVSVGAVGSYKFVDVQADHTISVTFARDTPGSFVIVPSAGEHGVITPPVPQTVAAGGSVTFSIVPDSGYKVLDVLVDGVSVGARATYEFTNVQADHTLSATFEKDPQVAYVITPEPGANGQITPPVRQTVAAGGSVTFEIVPDLGYHVADVKVDGASVGAKTSYTFTNVQADHTISATFAQDATPPPVTYTLTPSPGEHGQITPPVPQTVVAGASLTFLIVPDAGYHVADVLVDGASVGPRGSYRFTDVQADHTISATFAKDVGPTVSVSAPAADEQWAVGSTHTVSWSLSAPATDGRFTVWAVPASAPAVSLTPAASPVPVEAGKTEYSISYVVALAAPQAYEIRVRYESPSGEVRSEARGPGGVTAVPTVKLTVTAPKSGSVWRRGGTYTVGWKISGVVVAGSFRAWAVSASGKRYAITPAARPVTADASHRGYAVRWKVTAAAGKGYRVTVEYSWSGRTLASGKSGALTITPK